MDDETPALSSNPKDSTCKACNGSGMSGVYFCSICGGTGKDPQASRTPSDEPIITTPENEAPQEQILNPDIVPISDKNDTKPLSDELEQAIKALPRPDERTANYEIRAELSDIKTLFNHHLQRELEAFADKLKARLHPGGNEAFRVVVDHAIDELLQ